MSVEWWDTVGIFWLARFSLVVLFPFSTLDKLFNYRNAVAQARSSFLPGGPLLIVLGAATEILCTASILFGWHDRAGALLLAGYCAVTALLFHRFWSYGDFWAAGASEGRQHFWEFLKNFGLVGGLIFFASITQLQPASALLADPLSSIPPAANPRSQP